MMKNRFLFVVMLFTALTLGFASCDNDKGNNPDDPTPVVSPTFTDYVDLGLSVKWATCNVGAESPEEYGDYFAWGETTPKTIYNWSSYKWCNVSDKIITKYCTESDYGIVDNKTVLDFKDDAAAVNMGGSWRMPTKEEIEELIDKCTWTWTTLNGVKGYNVKGPNGNSIFLPTAGYCSGSLGNDAGKRGNYWSSSLFECEDEAYGLFFHYELAFYDSYEWCLEESPRYFGQSVRGVTK